MPSQYIPKPKVPGPLEERWKFTPYKGLDVTSVPTWIQNKFVHWEKTGEYDHPADKRYFVLHGLVPKHQRKTKPTADQVIQKKRDYERSYYHRVVKPKREAAKTKAEDETYLNSKWMEWSDKVYEARGLPNPELVRAEEFKKRCAEIYLETLPKPDLPKVE